MPALRESWAMAFSSAAPRVASNSHCDGDHCKFMTFLDNGFQGLAFRKKCNKEKYENKTLHTPR